MSPSFRLEPLSDVHDRGSFNCGQEALDRYLRTQATQDIRRRISTCFVAIESGTGQIESGTGQLAAYYTIAAASVVTSELPLEVTKKLPRYQSLPAVRIGRLAVDLTFQGRGLGAALLADALQRVLISPPAVFTLLVDAKDDSAVAFYRRHGFIPLISRPRTLFISIATAEKAWT
ncbi:MAG: GNAT family N-acetyltransferase [Bryobacteraceae bacterium]